MFCKDKFRTVISSNPQVVAAIVESGKNMSAEQKKTDRCPLLYEWHKKQYIGAAHGMAGIYYTLMQVRVDEELNGPHIWLLNKQNTQTSSSLYNTSVAHGCSILNNSVSFMIGVCITRVIRFVFTVPNG